MMFRAPLFPPAALSLLRAWRTLAALLFAATLASTAHAQIGASTSSVVQTEQVRAELLAHAPDGVGPGKTVWLGLQLQHQPQWHTYWKNPGDSGLPTTLAWTLPAGVSAGDIAWPTPKKIAIGSLANLGYEGTVLLPVPLTIASDFRPAGLAQDLEVRVTASWLVCRQECIPQDGQLVLRLPLRGSTAAQRTQFEAAWAAAPRPFAGPVQATVSDNGMALRVSGLPESWRGKAINAFPETHELLNTPALPSAGDTVQTTAASTPGTQGWQDGVWSASVPHSPQRSASPGQVAWVLVQGEERLRADSTVQGQWPATAARAEVSPALQAALAANAVAQTPVPAQGLLWVLAAALLGGLILNLMPCVFPVLAIKVLGFATQTQQPRSAQRAQGLAYAAGVVLSFLALGGLLLALRAGGAQLGWGFQLQSPGVVAVLALLFTLIALNLAGWLQVGSVLPQNLATLQLRHPLAEAFLSGVLAVAVASPCTAPFMGASLGYAITLPGAQALAIFAALGLGLALPYLLASWVPAVARWLPKPGAWMETLRHFLAFPMAATVVWLVWVLGHLSGVDGAGSLLLLILGVCMLVWALKLQGRSRTVLASLSLATCALLAWASGPYVLGYADAKVDNSATASATSADGWQPWAPGRVQAALDQGQPVFVDFTAAWCITCQVNKKTTLSNSEVRADLAARQVTLLRADWTRRDPAITQALQALGRSGVPVYVLYAPGKAPVVLSEILTPGELRRAIATL